MKIVITLTKNNNLSNPEIQVNYDDKSMPITLVDMQGCIHVEVDDHPTKDIILSIVRHEPINDTTHKTWVTVNKIVIDDFWVIGDNNHWSETKYDFDYFEYAKNLGATWELEKTLYNNVLFFNGKLSYKITRPARGMFFL